MTDRPEAAISRERRLVVDAADVGHRLDVLLARHLPDVSRSAVQRWIRDGAVRVDSAPAKASMIPDVGSEIVVDVPAPASSTLTAQPIALSVMYEDEDLVIIDKPAGMVVHPAAGHANGTLVNALLHHSRHLSGLSGTERPGIVHRLDKGTSGLIVVAKHDQAHRALAAQFHDRTVRKEYVALVWGVPTRGLVINQPIGRDPRNRLKMSTRSVKARTAETTVTAVEPLGTCAFVHVEIGTGRTHQIRVHLSEAGHPIVGDDTYGGARRAPGASAPHGPTRPLLHASRLEFQHPGRSSRVTFEAPLPEDFARYLATARRLVHAPTTRSSKEQP